MSRERIHRPDPPSTETQGRAHEPPEPGSGLEEARAMATNARDDLAAIDAVLGSFAVDDLRNAGGQ